MVTTRSGKGLPLTWAEVDANFEGLESSILGGIDAISTSLDNKADLDAYDRSTHTGVDAPILNERLATPYTLTADDALPSTTIRMNLATANTVVLPTYASVALPVGFRVPVDQWGDGATTIVGDTGVIVRSSAGTQIRARYGRVWLEKQGTDEWLITGDLAVGGTSGSPPFCTAAPSISGGPAAGATLTAVDGVWTGNPTPTVTGQWYANGVAIGGETAATYVTANPGDAGKVITYIESAVSSSGGPTTQTSNAITITSAAATKPVNATLPIISGTATVGNTLSTTNGTWSNSPTGYAYQWKRNGVAIASATSQTYLLAVDDSGTTITVTVTASNAAGDTEAPATSAGYPIAGALPTTSGSSYPAIYSATEVYETGVTLTVDVGTWLNNPTFTYQWYRADGTGSAAAIASATNSTYLTTADDADQIISCAVTGTSTSGSTTVNCLGVLISASSGMPVNSVAPVISGLTPIGSTLSCTTGTWTNTPTYAYQWKRGATNIGTDSSTYDTVAADGGSVITCVVTATANGLSAQATSSNSITVDAAGSGSLSVALSGYSPFTIDTVCPVDWILWPNATSPVVKNGGGSTISKVDSGTINAGSGTTSIAISWTDGDPTASGSLTGSGLAPPYGDATSGIDVTFPVGTSTTVCDVYVSAYNQILTYSVSLSDSSAAVVAGTIDSGPLASITTGRIRITANAASAAQTMTIVLRPTASEPYGNGGLAFRCAGIVS